MGVVVLLYLIPCLFGHWRVVCKDILLVFAHSHLYNDNDEQTRVQAGDLVRFTVCPRAFGIVHVFALRPGLSFSGHWW